MISEIQPQKSSSRLKNLIVANIFLTILLTIGILTNLLSAYDQINSNQLSSQPGKPISSQDTSPPPPPVKVNNHQPQLKTTAVASGTQITMESPIYLSFTIPSQYTAEPDYDSINIKDSQKTTITTIIWNEINPTNVIFSNKEDLLIPYTGTQCSRIYPEEFKTEELFSKPIFVGTAKKETCPNPSANTFTGWIDLILLDSQHAYTIAILELPQTNLSESILSTFLYGQSVNEYRYIPFVQPPLN